MWINKARVNRRVTLYGQHISQCTATYPGENGMHMFRKARTIHQLARDVRTITFNGYECAPMSTMSSSKMSTERKSSRGNITSHAKHKYLIMYVSYLIYAPIEVAD